jgi:hypothetical protein
MDPIEAAAMLAETTISRNGHEMDMPESEMLHIWESAKRSGLADVQLAKYRLFLKAYLSALVEDEGAVEAVAQTLCGLANPPESLIDPADHSEFVRTEAIGYRAEARAVLRALADIAGAETKP